MNELLQRVALDGTTFLISPTLEAARFPHAFSTRIGPGGSTYDLSRPGSSRIGTPPESCADALEHFATHLNPLRPQTISTAIQVHGCEVIEAGQPLDTEADGVISTDPACIAAIRTADCVGILLACPKTGFVAAVHAGWRGILADMPGTAVRALCTRTQEPPEALLAAIGPAIGVDVFEVGDEVAKAFGDAGLAGHLCDGYGPKAHLNLHSAAKNRLIDAGIPPNSIDGTPLCTYSDPRFFSYRGEGTKSGSLIAGIAPIPKQTA